MFWSCSQRGVRVGVGSDFLLDLGMGMGNERYLASERSLWVRDPQVGQQAGNSKRRVQVVNFGWSYPLRLSDVFRMAAVR